MSRTYVIACHDCRTSLWIGQGANGKTFDENGYIYTTPPAIAGLSKFLKTHQGHHLEFNHDEDQKICGFEQTDEFGEILQERED